MNTLSVRVWRGGPEAEAGRFVTYDVPRLPAQTVLDVVTHIQRRHRSDARVPFRLPRRHVRLVRDDGQRPRALDLPHARRGGGRRTARWRSRRSRICR